MSTIVLMYYTIYKISKEENILIVKLCQYREMSVIFMWILKIKISN